MNQNIKNYDDEIDLFELFESIWQQKILVLLITIATFLGSVLFLTFTPKTYQTNIFIDEPTQSDLHDLNQQNLIKITPASIFKSYQNEFLSIKNRQNFLQEKYQKTFNSKQIDGIFKLVLPAKNAVTKYVELQMTNQDQQNLAQYLNEYFQITKQQLVQSLEQDFLVLKKNKLDFLEQKRQFLISNADRKRLERIEILTEALEIAKAGGIINFANEKDVVNWDLPNYLKGTKVLEAEIKALKLRTNPEKFDPEIKKIQLEIDELNSLKIDFSQVEPAKVEQFAIEPKSPISPKSKLVLAIGLVLGGMLGIFAALLRSAIRKRKNQ